MFDIKKPIALALSAAALCCCLAGCGQEEAQPTQPSSSTPSQSTEATQPTQATDATQPSEPVEQVLVKYNGLHFNLDSSYTTSEEADKLTFQNDKIQGGVEFGTVSELTGGHAQTSADYAKYLQSELGAGYENSWVGSSTGIGYYLVLQNATETQVRCLYIKGDAAWNIWAQSEDTALTDELVRICGRCAMISEEIPQV